MSFDPVRAAFYLVAFVIMAQVAVAIAVAGACLVYSDAIVSGRFKCDADNRAFDLLQSSLSSALAFAGGWMTGRLK